jgi:hypothetical protein
MAKLISALVLVLVLAVPYPAAAACAWLLWYFEAPFGWSLLLATATKPECDQRAHELLAQVRPSPASLRTPGPPLLNYQCFPETVDPRGAKGSGR